ncbi:DUF3575 domain-containing protein [Tenacibaculum aestuariivivum]|uniref:DUF3575 domain-containing protein n=1 Tax=Tenacibaculum aestuariivivum TaxID=2006131 RepID=UPI003AB298B9
MKKIILTVLLFSIFIVKAQNKKNNSNIFYKKNELKLNVTFPMFGILEVAYERNLNKKSSLGISGLYVVNKNSDEDTNYLISPYYRRYFGKKFASGFFLEGFGTLSSIDGKKIIDGNGIRTRNEGADVMDLSLGLSLGNKWVTKNGITFELFAGLGKQLFNATKTDHDIVTRFGLNVGYRF